MGTLDGVNIRDYFRSPGWLFYNQVHVGQRSTCSVRWRRGRTDAVVADDVLEHFEPPMAARFVSELQRVGRSLVIVGYPLTVSEVGDAGVEQHRVVVNPATLLAASPTA